MRRSLLGKQYRGFSSRGDCPLAHRICELYVMDVERMWRAEKVRVDVEGIQCKILVMISHSPPLHERQNTKRSSGCLI